MLWNLSKPIARLSQTAGDGWNVPPIPAERFNVNLRDGRLGEFVLLAELKVTNQFYEENMHVAQ